MEPGCGFLSQTEDRWFATKLIVPDGIRKASLNAKVDIAIVLNDLPTAYSWQTVISEGGL